MEDWYRWPDERIEAYIRDHEDTENAEMIDRIIRMENELGNRALCPCLLATAYRRAVRREL